MQLPIQHLHLPLVPLDQLLLEHALLVLHADQLFVVLLLSQVQLFVEGALRAGA